MQVKALVRWSIVLPLTGIASLCWVSMLAGWIGHSKRADEEIVDKALKQTLAQTPPEPPKPQEKEKTPPPQRKPEPSPKEMAQASQESRPEASREEPSPSAKAQDESRVNSMRGARAMASRGEPGGSASEHAGPRGVTLSGSRSEIERRGLDYLAKGKSLNSLPPTEGDSPSLESYCEFGRLSGFRYVVFSREKRKYIGELTLGKNPRILPLDTESWGGRFASKGRLIEHPALTAISQDAAQRLGEGETSLYAFTPISFDSFVAGKILKVLELCRVDRNDVLAFEVRFEVRESRPIVIFTGVRLVSGKVIPINDTEG